MNTVPIFQVCQRMQFDPGLDVHARLAFFVWQMRRTSRAVPWIFNKSTYTTGYNGSGSAYSPRFHRTMFGVLSHCLRLTVSSGTPEWIIRFGLEFPPKMARPNKSSCHHFSYDETIVGHAARACRPGPAARGPGLARPGGAGRAWALLQARGPARPVKWPKAR